MIENAPPAIPKEPAFWKGTIFSVTAHALLLGSIWIAAWQPWHRDDAAALNKVEGQRPALTETIGKPASTASSSVLPEIKPVVKEAKAKTFSGAAVASHNRNETTLPTIAAKPSAAKLLTEPKRVEKKRIAHKQLATLLEKEKLIKKKKKERERSLQMLAQQHQKQKLKALALQKKKKQQTEQSEMIAKKRAAELALKTAAETQKRKELNEERTLEKLRQDEMRRITNDSAASEGRGNS